MQSDRIKEKTNSVMKMMANYVDEMMSGLVDIIKQSKMQEFTKEEVLILLEAHKENCISNILSTLDTD